MKFWMADGRMLIEPIGGTRSMIAKLWSLVAALAVVGSFVVAGATDPEAQTRATLFEMVEKLPGSKVLDGRWGVERYAIAIPKGRDQGRVFVEKFTADAKSEGLVKAAIARAGLRGAMTSDSK
jgi:polar amino acid transport system substrate-binding protein